MTPPRTARRTARRTTRAAALLAVVAAGLTTGATSASAAAPSLDRQPAPRAAAVAAATPVDVLALVGTNRQLYVKTTDAPGFNNLGGTLTEEPAVAFGDEAYFVGIGANDELYVRTPRQGWARLADGSRCTGVSAAISGSTLAVACRGTNGSLYVGKARADSATTGRLPQITTFRNKGGQMQYGATVGVAGDAFFYDVIGLNNRVYEASDTQGLRAVSNSPTCFGSLGVDSFLGGGAACRAENGSLQVLSNTSGTFRTIAGTVVGRPGVAVSADRSSRYYALGTNGEIYTATQSATGTLGGFRNTPDGSGQFGILAGNLG